jgi:hypothetical protein
VCLSPLLKIIDCLTYLFFNWVPSVQSQAHAVLPVQNTHLRENDKTVNHKDRVKCIRTCIYTLLNTEKETHTLHPMFCLHNHGRRSHATRTGGVGVFENEVLRNHVTLLRQKNPLHFSFSQITVWTEGHRREDLITLTHTTLHTDHRALSIYR